MIYYAVEKNEEGLFLVEKTYDPNFALKTESSFAQCNGYIGVRASFDCKVLNENRGMFIGGLYQTAEKNEVAELVNCPDLTEVQLSLEGEKFSFESCTVENYDRRLNIYTGELNITATCTLKNGVTIKVESKRFVSDVNCHLFCQTFAVTPLNQDVAALELVSGINGQITNSGVSHFNQIECRVYDKKYMSLTGCLKEDSLHLFCGTGISGGSIQSQSNFVLKRRSIYESACLMVEKGQTMIFSKISYIDVSKTQRYECVEKRIGCLKNCLSKGYRKLYEEHKESMQKFWRYAKISIDGATPEEEAAISFAQYHLKGMTPRETSLYSVAAKGLTGEGYKGHVFWDTEIFVLPFFLYLFPNQAKNLLLFRYRGLPQAREKAQQFGCSGVMFPWETAKNGFEETPLYAQLNIHTGKANRVWSGIKECHVTADIAYAVWNYYTLTNDTEFMLKYGSQIIFESAIFWVSRAVYVRESESYVIRDVIGPDEYDEHVDNNAYTNYMAWFCVKLAVHILKNLKTNHPEQLDRLGKELELEKHEPVWKDFVEKIYLPQPGDRHIIPQDDSFLSKKELPDIQKYRDSKVKQSILLDYSRDEVVNMQVLKQADVVMIFNLLPNLFRREVMRDNIIFYEERTLHDSSLSHGAYAQACANIGFSEQAYTFFKEAMEIDINDNPYDSTDGIHSASLGGVWNCVVCGFAGVSHGEGTLRISPALPAAWKSMNFYLKIQNTYLHISLSDCRIEIKCGQPLQTNIFVEIYGRKYELHDCLTVQAPKTDERLSE